MTFIQIAHLEVETRPGGEWASMLTATLGIKDDKWALSEPYSWPSFGKAIRDAENALKEEDEGAEPLPNMRFLTHFAKACAAAPETDDVDETPSGRTRDFDAYLTREILTVERFVIAALMLQHLVPGAGATHYRVTLRVAIAGYVPVTPKYVWPYETFTGLRRIKPIKPKKTG